MCHPRDEEVSCLSGRVWGGCSQRCCLIPSLSLSHCLSTLSACTVLHLPYKQAKKLFVLKRKVCQKGNVKAHPPTHQSIICLSSMLTRRRRRTFLLLLLLLLLPLLLLLVFLGGERGEEDVADTGVVAPEVYGHEGDDEGCQVLESSNF